MRLEAVIIKNFRAYKDATRFDFDNITTIIGRNDVGKSTVLEALEIFFNNETVKIDQSDGNVFGGGAPVKITAEFSELPAEITLDAGAPTSLEAEFLVSANGHLTIQKVYDCTKKTVTAETFILEQNTGEYFDDFVVVTDEQITPARCGNGEQIVIACDNRNERHCAIVLDDMRKIEGPTTIMAVERALGPDIDVQNSLYCLIYDGFVEHLSPDETVDDAPFIQTTAA